MEVPLEYTWSLKKVPFWTEPSCSLPSPPPTPWFQSHLNYNNSYIVMGTRRRGKILENSLPFIEFIPPNARSKSCPAAFFFFSNFPLFFSQLRTSMLWASAIVCRCAFLMFTTLISFLDGLFELREEDLNQNSSLKVSNYFINNILNEYTRTVRGFPADTRLILQSPLQVVKSPE